MARAFAFRLAPRLDKKDEKRWKTMKRDKKGKNMSRCSVIDSVERDAGMRHLPAQLSSAVEDHCALANICQLFIEAPVISSSPVHFTPGIDSSWNFHLRLQCHSWTWCQWLVERQWAVSKQGHGLILKNPHHLFSKQDKQVGHTLPASWVHRHLGVVGLRRAKSCCKYVPCLEYPESLADQVLMTIASPV